MSNQEESLMTTKAWCMALLLALSSLAVLAVVGCNKESRKAEGPKGKPTQVAGRALGQRALARHRYPGERGVAVRGWWQLYRRSSPKENEKDGKYSRIAARDSG